MLVAATLISFSVLPATNSTENKLFSVLFLCFQNQKSQRFQKTRVKPIQTPRTPVCFCSFCNLETLKAGVFCGFPLFYVTFLRYSSFKGNCKYSLWIAGDTWKENWGYGAGYKIDIYISLWYFRNTSFLHICLSF